MSTNVSSPPPLTVAELVKKAATLGRYRPNAALTSQLLGRISRHPFGALKREH